MNAIAPATGAPEVVLDPKGETYNPLPVCLYGDPDLPGVTVVLSRWQPTAEERQAVLNGEDIFVAQLVDGDRVQPVSVTVGPDRYVVEPGAPIIAADTPVTEGNPEPASQAEGAE